MIFCRNLFIYFTPACVREVALSLARAMPSPGYLCVGAAESLLQSRRRIRPARTWRGVRVRQAMSDALCRCQLVSPSIVRVLVVDDSAYVRKMMTQMLTRSPFVDVVGTARDGAEALELASALQAGRDHLRPEHAGDGRRGLRAPADGDVGRCRSSSSASPIPSGEQVLAALEAGAVDFLQKPTALATDRLLEVADELVAKVKAAAGAQIVARRRRGAGPETGRVGRLDPSVAAATDVAADRHLDRRTAGAEGADAAASRRTSRCRSPSSCTCRSATPSSTRRSSTSCRQLRVKEAVEGEVIDAGTRVSGAGRAGTCRSVELARRCVAHLDLRPLDTLHRPAVDVLFQSAADVYGARRLGVVMTGMGADGREGAAWIKARGGQILTEAEQSCVVYGMPRSVVEAGLSDYIASLETMFDVILERL